MDKKKVISTTIMFLVIVAAIIGFKSIFGEINTLVGVAGITAALSLLGTDYTITPIKSTIYFVFIEVLLGVSSFLASTNAFLGLVITFAIIFFILYQFTYNTKKPTYIAFTLGYFFMLYTPVSINELPTRLVSLIFCGLFIMTVQMIANKNKLQKQSKVTIKTVIESINEEIVLMINNDSIESVNNLNSKTYDTLKEHISDVYKRLDKNIELPVSLIQSLFICQFLESVNLILEEVKNNTINEEFTYILNKIKALLCNIDEFIDRNITVDDVILKIDEFLIASEKSNSKYYKIYELQGCVILLKEDLILSKEKNSKEVCEKYFVSNAVDILNDLKNNLNKDSLKFTFAFRGALITSIGVFVVAFFNIPHGKWLVFSLSSIVQPYLESGQAKGRERILGTIIGLIIFEILFSIVTDNSMRAFIILIVGYISNYQTEYKYQMICTTISALGAASIGNNINELSISRIFFVLLGTIIALYANKVILPYKMSDVTKNEVKNSLSLNEQILAKLYNTGLVNGTINDDLKDVITQNIRLNKKIYFNNNILLSDDLNEFVHKQHIFINKLRFLVNNFKKYTNKNSSHNLVLFYDIDMLLNKDISTKDIIDFLNNIDDRLSKLILINVLELKETIIESKDISKVIYKTL